MLTFFWAGLIWVVGLVTLVPYGAYYLLFQAPREQYALLITGVLFWVFGYWGVVGPLLAAWKIRSVFRSLERAHEQGKLHEALRSRETQEVAVDFIASENGIPRFLAARVYRLLAERLATRGPSAD